MDLRVKLATEMPGNFSAVRAERGSHLQPALNGDAPIDGNSAAFRPSQQQNCGACEHFSGCRRQAYAATPRRVTGSRGDSKTIGGTSESVHLRNCRGNRLVPRRYNGVASSRDKGQVSDYRLQWHDVRLHATSGFDAKRPSATAKLAN